MGVYEPVKHLRRNFPTESGQGRGCPSKRNLKSKNPFTRRRPASDSYPLQRRTEKRRRMLKMLMHPSIRLIGQSEAKREQGRFGVIPGPDVLVAGRPGA